MKQILKELVKYTKLNDLGEEMETRQALDIVKSFETLGEALNMRDFTEAEELLWGFMIMAEGECEDTDVLKKADVEATYRYFREQGLTTSCPRWKENESKTA